MKKLLKIVKMSGVVGGWGVGGDWGMDWSPPMATASGPHTQHSRSRALSTWNSAEEVPGSKSAPRRGEASQRSPFMVYGSTEPLFALVSHQNLY